MSIYMLLLPEGQTDEAWEPYKKQRSFTNRGGGALDRKRLHCAYKLAVRMHPEGPATDHPHQGFPWSSSVLQQMLCR